MSIDSINPSYKEIIDDVTREAIYYINSTPNLFKRLKGLTEALCASESVLWAEEHGNEFGRLFQTELDMVDWAQVKRMI